MSSLPHERPRATRGDRAFATRWGAGFLLIVGALLMVLGSCGNNAGPPQPAASAAGTIDTLDTADPTAASSVAPAASSSPSPAGPTTDPRTGSQPADASDKPPGTTGSAASAPATSARPTSATATPNTPGPPTTRSSIVVPSFEPPAVKGPVLAASPPVSIAIPAISVSAPVSDLGLMPDGSIQVPPLEETNETGWYTGSPAPGVQGPSVILGHVDSARSGPSVFYSLGSLKPGDEVSVSRKDGTVAVFRVDGVRSYGKNQFPTEVVYGNLDHAGLRLITCGGTFDPKAGHYESNIVAFASLVSSHRA